MATNRPVIYGAIAVAAAGAGLAFFFTHKKHPPADQAAETTPEKTKPRAGGDDSRGGAGGGRGQQEMNVLIDDDVEGTERLEGLVVDKDDRPVAGAIVTVSTNPPRTTKSEADGSFAFDKLVGREYTLVGRAPAGVGGPVTARLTKTSDPITLHLVPAASAEITVYEASDHKPVAGATVELRDLETIGGTTDDSGKVLLSSIAPGGYSVVAWAPGHAKSFSNINIPRQTSGDPLVAREEIVIRRGAPVSGRVVTSDGKGVSGALVEFSGVSDWSTQSDPRRDAAKTDGNGAYKFDAMPPGTFRFTARAENLAPGSTAAITLDGQNEKTGVDITLDAGATIAGRVVTKGGDAVGYATIRVAEKVEGMRFAEARQSFSDDKGHFEVKGLPKKKIEIVALADAGASETIDADLTTGDKRDLVIKLDLDGTIAGTVVDSKGQPIAEAEVSAFPDFRKGAKAGRMEWQLRGRAQDLTDAGGRFTLRGLTPGAYQVRASRTGGGGFNRMFLQDPTEANVGDTNVKIVLPATGGVKGKVALATGAPPDTFTVGLGRGNRTPFATKDGSFSLNDLPPGDFDLAIDGPQFDRRTVKVTISSDQITDAGTITVAKGRTISGYVMANGQPVPGATVYSGHRVGGDGSSPSTRGFGPAFGGTKSSTTGDDGGFTLSGVGATELALMANHDTLGRSTTIEVPPGKDDVIINLNLLPFGSLEGTVTKAGQPVENVIVNVSSQNVPNTNFGVASGPDGTFRFDKLAPDTYLASAMGGMKGGGMMGGMSFRQQVVTVVSGQTAKVNLQVIEGTGVLNVSTVLKEGGSPGFAFVIYADFPITSKTVNAVQHEMAAHGDGLNGFSLALGGSAKIEHLTPGTYTACAAILPKEVSGMNQGRTYFTNHGDELTVGCASAPVTDGAEQPLTITVDYPPFIQDDPGAGTPAPAPGGGGGGGT